VETSLVIAEDSHDKTTEEPKGSAIRRKRALKEVSLNIPAAPPAPIDAVVKPVVASRATRSRATKA